MHRHNFNVDINSDMYEKVKQERQEITAHTMCSQSFRENKSIKKKRPEGKLPNINNGCLSVIEFFSVSLYVFVLCSQWACFILIIRAIIKMINTISKSPN